MTKNWYLSLESMYIIDISIYLDLPREEQIDTGASQTGRQTDRRMNNLNIIVYISPHLSAPLGQRTGRQMKRLTVEKNNLYNPCLTKCVFIPQTGVIAG